MLPSFIHTFFLPLKDHLLGISHTSHNSPLHPGMPRPFYLFFKVSAAHLTRPVPLYRAYDTRSVIFIIFRLVRLPNTPQTIYRPNVKHRWRRINGNISLTEPFAYPILNFLLHQRRLLLIFNKAHSSHRYIISFPVLGLLSSHPLSS